MKRHKTPKRATPPKERKGIFQGYVGWLIDFLNAQREKIKKLPQRQAAILHPLFVVLMVGVVLVYLAVVVGVVLPLMLAVLLLGALVRRPGLVMLLLVLAFVACGGIALYRQSIGDEVGKWAWAKLAFWSGGLFVVAGVISWFRNPTFYPEAARGYYMGQSLNNQRQIREDLSEIRSRLDE